MDVVQRFTRGAVAVHALHHAAERPIHGAWIAQELAHHGYAISPGTLYPLLHRLELDGLLASRSAVEGGYARRVYTITDTGRAALARLRAAVAELANEVLEDVDR